MYSTDSDEDATVPSDPETLSDFMHAVQLKFKQMSDAGASFRSQPLCIKCPAGSPFENLVFDEVICKGLKSMGYNPYDKENVYDQDGLGFTIFIPRATVHGIKK